MNQETELTPHEKLVYDLELKMNLKVHNDLDSSAYAALLAMVKLHEPVDSPWCNWECCGNYCKECKIPFPCRSYSTIETTLGR